MMLDKIFWNVDGAGRRPGGSSTAPLFPAIMLESHDTSYKQDKIEAQDSNQ